MRLREALDLLAIENSQRELVKSIKLQKRSYEGIHLDVQRCCCCSSIVNNVEKWLNFFFRPFQLRLVLKVVRKGRGTCLTISF